MCAGQVVDIRVRLAGMLPNRTTRDLLGEEGEGVLMLLADLQVQQVSEAARGHGTHTQPECIAITRPTQVKNMSLCSLTLAEWREPNFLAGATAELLT